MSDGTWLGLGLSHADWVELGKPVVGALVLGSGALATAVLSGLTGKVNAYFAAHGDTLAAQKLATANAAIDKEIETSASVIAGEIDRGELDYSDRTAWQKRALAEVALVKARLPALAMSAVEQGTPLLVQLMARVDSKAVASPTINVPTPGIGALSANAPSAGAQLVK